jgi:outer membrane biosynthesis protein TonB
MTETEIWTKWESQVVNGIFPLRRFLGRSNHSVVFLTECRTRNLVNAAIKIIPADPARAEAQLSRWQLAAALSHPHLIRILEAGRCKLGGHSFLFVVTEYAEQNLAQILPHRALTVEEVREMLIPALDALAFLHGQNLAHGQLQPPNFLVVNDQLKLSSDTIRAAREAAELAADMRALGATIAEALTQTRPAPDQRTIAPLPAAVSAELAEGVRRCLSPEPGDRPTVSELRARIEPAPAAPAQSLPAPEPPAAEARVPAPEVPVAVVTVSEVPSAAAKVSARPAPAHPPAAARSPVPAAAPRRAAPESQARWLVPAAALGLVLLAVWAGGRVLRSHSGSVRPNADPIASQQTATPPPAQSSVIAQSAVSPVVHEEIPAVSRGARDSIHGQIKVAVRVTVDRAGNVVAENLEVHGSSRYFARLASDAAKKWKFAPADNQSPREWLLQFDFSRGGVTGHADPRVRP